MKKSLNFVFIIMLGFVFAACATNEGPKKSRVSKVYEVKYSKGISVFVGNYDVRKNLEISDARISYGKNKRHVQFVVNNTSSNIYNLLLDSQWTDERNVKVSSYPMIKKISIKPNSSRMVVLDAPSYKAKDVLIRVRCGANCIVEPK